MTDSNLPDQAPESGETVEPTRNPFEAITTVVTDLMHAFHEVLHGADVEELVDKSKLGDGINREELITDLRSMQDYLAKMFPDEDADEDDDDEDADDEE